MAYPPVLWPEAEKIYFDSDGITLIVPGRPDMKLVASAIRAMGQSLVVDMYFTRHWSYPGQLLMTTRDAAALSLVDVNCETLATTGPLPYGTRHGGRPEYDLAINTRYEDEGYVSDLD